MLIRIEVMELELQLVLALVARTRRLERRKKRALPAVSADESIPLEEYREMQALRVLRARGSQSAW